MVMWPERPVALAGTRATTLPSGTVLPSPLISVIVAAHDLQGSLENCLKSILTQSFRDVEVIVVLDRSAECPADLVDAYAQRDGRVSVVQLDGSVGIGQVRNAGAEHATGDYLLFLDSDHIVKGATLQAMADRLQTADEPDILLFGHTRLHRGRSWPGTAEGVLSLLGRNPFTPIDHPELFGVPAYAWDRLLRRDLWIRQALAFPDGLHEEIAVVHRALLGADRIAVLKWECVQISRRLTQHPAGSPGGTHFDVFNRYEESFGLLKGHGGLDAAAPFLFTRMIRHCLFVLNLSGCLSRTERPQFFQQAVEHYRRFLPDGYERPDGREGVKFQLIAGGTYSAFEAAKLTNLAGLARGVVSRGR
ncbi:glycosyltransferase family 2 protein [Kitasatospora sp. MAP5-34]|uniref:glycosyltransferase family 2 protein n=1 Tax=Kitasatospora sp. MAP5-34 TaxID=3035102 RepID=UPI0024756EFB|nr:glycosyltransferase family 2 protein [Kitasatospora sp. MAP5-34]MDH6577477.1 glycosyltransferase involved in cell wall biosynthesis [Kitasatospora sp. MAP5-34]